MSFIFQVPVFFEPFLPHTHTLLNFIVFPVALCGMPSKMPRLWRDCTILLRPTSVPQNKSVEIFPCLIWPFRKSQAIIFLDSKILGVKQPQNHNHNKKSKIITKENKQQKKDMEQISTENFPKIPFFSSKKRVGLFRITQALPPIRPGERLRGFSPWRDRTCLKRLRIGGAYLKPTNPYKWPY